MTTEIQFLLINYSIFYVVLTNTCDITQRVHTRITESCSKIILKIALKSIAAIISIHRISVVGRSSYIILCVLGSILPRRRLIQVHPTFFGNICFFHLIVLK